MHSTRHATSPSPLAAPSSAAPSGTPDSTRSAPAHSTSDHSSSASSTASPLTPTDRAVRELYDRYPYPDGPPMLRAGYDVRQVLSTGRLTRADTGALGRPLRVLDAGCGRGVGLLGEATVQPDVEYLGIDLNRRALDEVRERVRASGLANVRVAEVDLVTLAGLDVPNGGFDVIRSSGVIHHLDDPTAALARLGDVLAPHGVLDVMVYGRLGRAAIHRVAAAVTAAVPADLEFDARIALARRLCASRADALDPACPFGSAARCGDVEFADRYLHPRERAYSVTELIEAATEAGLAPLELPDRRAWDPARWITDPTTLAALDRRPPLEQLRAIEQLAAPDRLEARFCRPENGPREPLSETQLDATFFLAHPDAAFEVTTRVAPTGLRTEAVAVRERHHPAEPLTDGPTALAAALAARRAQPWRGAELVAELASRGLPESAARAALLALVQRELVHAPHPCELT
jgi:SAM-dependent methyltransferase